MPACRAGLALPVAGEHRTGGGGSPTVQASASPTRGRAAAALILALALAACGGGERPRDAPPGLAAGSAELGPADLGFLSQAAYNDLAAIDLGRMARQESADPAVRALAARLVDEHRDSLQELRTMAGGYEVDLPEHLNAGRGAVDDRLSSLDGAAFDAQYLQQQIADHEVAQALYQNEADRGGDPALREFAQRWLPTLERRADELRALSDRLAGLPPAMAAPQAAPPPEPSPEAPAEAAPLPPPETLAPQDLAPEDVPPPEGDAGNPPAAPPPGGDMAPPPAEPPSTEPPAAQQPLPRIDVP